MTPLYFSPKQRTTYDFVSLSKIPLFVEQSGREPITDFSEYGAIPPRSMCWIGLRLGVDSCRDPENTKDSSRGTNNEWYLSHHYPAERRW